MTKTLKWREVANDKRMTSIAKNLTRWQAFHLGALWMSVGWWMDQWLDLEPASPKVLLITAAAVGAIGGGWILAVVAHSWWVAR